ncbi:MAG: hypothetical protein JRH20_30420, partial [Deltaproteobacteria bacterium]|nr:hypothetical protein [Deltaproteobacteria bacterium]
CTEWGLPIACPESQICNGGACTGGQCSNMCTEGTTRCDATGQVQTCELTSSGCTDWGAPKPCATGSCVNGKCDTGVCVKDDVRCNGTMVETCDAGGYWLVTQVCPQACDQGGCTTEVTCTAVARRCNGEVVEECNATGTAWLYLQSCPYGCKDGLCEGGCDPGDDRCNADQVETCKADGSGWEAGADCSATFCYQGVCAEPNLLLDNQTVTMEGQHVYDGDVILKNNAHINIGPSGWLRIRAKNIDIDATSDIVAPAVGDDPRGKGGSGGTKSCTPTYCSSSASGTVYGGGGGYGTKGADASTRLSRYCSGTRYCYIYGYGGALNTGYVADIHLGSSGGSCTNANGGGMIDLLASGKIVMSGTLRADGGDRVAGGGTYCNYGSGGGIRVQAEDLSIDGVISADRGGSAGGQGRIKLLYGSKNALSGTMTGVVEKSLIPPQDLASSTHPKSTLYYNDDFKQFNLAWARPYSNNSAYYYTLNTALPTAQSHVPDSQSTYHVSESVSFDRDQLVTGSNYFHGVAFGVGSTLGTVEQSFLLRINTTPPTIRSSSHPSSSNWYDLPTALFSWTNPRADENYRAYYFVFDRYANTIPNKSDSKLPVDAKSHNRPSLPVGTIWYFHVIGEDTMGYLTKAARHFRVQIGPNPGLGGMSGSVRDADSNATLDDVTITLNRGYMHTSSANSGTYFFADNLPAIANGYELRAEKTGYERFVKNIAIETGENLSLNILLKKLP